MKFVANPVEVEAFEIVSIDRMPDADPPLGRHVATSDGENRFADAGMCARYLPQVGDYWVIQADGYAYLNPKDVFERKYSPVNTNPPVDMSQQAAMRNVNPL